MKVLHILYSGLGGHGNVFFSMVEADAKKEYNFEALFTGVEPVREEYIERCNTNSVPFTYINKTPGKKHLSFFYSVFKAVLKSKADVIFIHGSIMLLPAWFAKKIGFSNKKIIVRETQAIHLKTGRETKAFNFSMKLADKIVFLSDEYKNQTQQNMGSQFNAAKTHIIPNGIDLKFFSPKQQEIERSVVKIGMQSRIVPIKDHKTLLAAFKIVTELVPYKTFELVIAGDGEMLNELTNLANTLNIYKQTTFTGLLSEKDLPDFLNDLDIYVHASFGETMSTAIMQAMACGKAIIASDVDGIKNMITDGEDGLLVEVKNENKLAEKILLLLNNDSIKKKLESNAHLKAQQAFSNTRMFNSYKKILA